MTTKTLQALLITALLASVSAFADQSIDVSVVNGKQQASSAWATPSACWSTTRSSAPRWSWPPTEPPRNEFPQLMPSR